MPAQFIHAAVASVVALTVAGAASAAIVTLNPVADTTLFSDQPDNNNSGSVSVILDGIDVNTPGANNRVRQGLMKFDFSSIPVGSVVTDAQLTLTRGPNAGFAQVSIYNSLVDIDGSETWNSLVDGIEIGVETSANPAQVGGLGSNGSTTYDITGLVATDVLSPANNQGIVLVGGENNTFLDIASADSPTPPSLRVEFTPIPEPATAGLLALAGLALRRRRA